MGIQMPGLHFIPLEQNLLRLEPGICAFKISLGDCEEGIGAIVLGHWVAPKVAWMLLLFNLHHKQTQI